MRKRFFVCSFIAVAILVLGMSEPCRAQWPSGTATVYWYVDASVNSLNFTPSSSNIKTEVEEMMDAIDNVWSYNAGLPVTLTERTSSGQYPCIKVMAGSMSWFPGDPLGETWPIPNCATNVSGYEVVITINNSSQIIYCDCIDPDYGRDLSLETAPYTNIDLCSVLLHELAHAMGMNGEGGIGATIGAYHGSDREVDAEEASMFRYLYSTCHTMTFPHWQRTSVNFDGEEGGVLKANQWSPRVTPSTTMQTRESGWTVTWNAGSSIPTVEADELQQYDGQDMKFWQWQLNDNPNNVATLYDNVVLVQTNGETAFAHYYQAHEYTFTEGEYCDGTVAPCSYDIGALSVVAPYSGYQIVGRETVVAEATSGSSPFLYWKDSNNNKYYTNSLTIDASQASEYTPVFQKHLASNAVVSYAESESGTSTNNQRKIDYVDGIPGQHHQVFESCGNIYYMNRSAGIWNSCMTSEPLGQKWGRF